MRKFFGFWCSKVNAMMWAMEGLSDYELTMKQHFESEVFFIGSLANYKGLIKLARLLRLNKQKRIAFRTANTTLINWISKNATIHAMSNGVKSNERYAFRIYCTLHRIPGGLKRIKVVYEKEETKFTSEIC